MRLAIDNTDYTAALDAERLPAITRRLNRPDEMRASLIGSAPEFVVPAAGARVVLQRDDGFTLFSGYLSAAPEHEYLGWNERGPEYRYGLEAVGDDFLLDARLPAARPAFVARCAGEIVRSITEDLLPGRFDLGAAADLDPVPWYSAGARRWSEMVADLCGRCRARYRLQQGALALEPVGAVVHTLDEAAGGFCPDALKLRRTAKTINDVTVLGRYEPAAYVKDYFVGDGISLNFPLSHMPFTRYQASLLDEEYAGTQLDPRIWTKSDPASALSVSGGALHIAGGAAVVSFNEQVELGGALLLQHGSLELTAASDGIVGGLYNGEVALANCVGGFRITPAGAQSTIRPLVNGVLAGTPVTTVAGHRYFLTTRIYATELYRCRQSFRSSVGSHGGETIASDMRLVLEVHDIDPADPGTEAAPAALLFDDVLANVPAYCTYAPVNATAIFGSLAFTRLARQADGEVRSAFPGQPYKTRLVGYISEGGECRIFDSPELHFHAEHVPAPDEKIVVTYRGSDQGQSRVNDAASIAALAAPGDDGIRAGVVQCKAPPARTSAECDSAALALLDDAVQTPWSGSCQALSDFLADVLPGDAVEVSAPSRNASFSAIVRQVGVEVVDAATDRSRYTVRFANDAAEPLGVVADASDAAQSEIAVPISAVSTAFAPDLPRAEIIAYSSIDVTIDAGCDPPAGGGLEARRSDDGWGPAADRNLIGRFASRSFSIPRLSRSQDCYLRQYDAAGRYSRYSTALHLDCPL